MPNSNDFVSYASELLASAGHVVIKRMFGGHGMYVDGMFLAIIADDVLYLKADEITRAAFDAESCVPFVFEKDGKAMVTSYRRAPDDAMDAPHLMLPWAQRALAAALRARTLKSKPKNKPAAKKKSSRPASNTRKKKRVTK
jgi:DNA transformation protein and related proteins